MPDRRAKRTKKEGKPKVFGVMDEDYVWDDETATTADLTQLESDWSDNESDEDDDEEFALENAPRPPPEKLLYNGEGTSGNKGGFLGELF